MNYSELVPVTGLTLSAWVQPDSLSSDCCALGSECRRTVRGAVKAVTSQYERFREEIVKHVPKKCKHEFRLISFHDIIKAVVIR
jgi:hypothetical protein